MSTRAPSIEVIDLVKRFPLRPGWRSLFKRGEEKEALGDVNLAVSPGEIFGLLGPNGAGKTTLIRVLSTLVIPTAGAAYVGGLNVVEHSREVRRRLGVIYGDERSFFWRLSAEENLRFYAALHQIPRHQIEHRIGELLALVGLTEAASMQMHHFSSGMKQRLSIARGLLNDPEILFMDEPTHNLDPIAARELRALVRERVANGRRTVLLTTNIMAEAEELCHRVAFINKGRIQLIGSIYELRAALQPEDIYVLTVSRVDAMTLQALRGVPGVRSLQITDDNEGRYRLELGVERDSAAVPLVIRHVVEIGGYVWSSIYQELSLEQMFSMTMSSGKQLQPSLERL